MSRRIMVIEDTAELRELLHELLTEEGYVVLPYAAPVTDVAEVLRVSPDLIILDLLFDGQALGWELLRKLRFQPATARIPVFVCTAAAHQVDAHGSELQGQPIRVVAKPFDVDELLDAVSGELRTSHDWASKPSQEAARGM